MCHCGRSIPYFTPKNIYLAECQILVNAFKLSETRNDDHIYLFTLCWQYVSGRDGLFPILFERWEQNVTVEKHQNIKGNPKKKTLSWRNHSISPYFFTRKTSIQCRIFRFNKFILFMVYDQAKSVTLVCWSHLFH